MDPQRPRSVTGATCLVIALVALSGVTAACTAAFKSDLVDSWAAGRTDAGSVDPPAFVPVVIVMFVVHALLIGVLTMLFREGHNWARIVLSVVALLTALAALAGVQAHELRGRSLDLGHAQLGGHLPGVDPVRTGGQNEQR